MSSSQSVATRFSLPLFTPTNPFLRQVNKNNDLANFNEKVVYIMPVMGHGLLSHYFYSDLALLKPSKNFWANSFWLRSPPYFSLREPNVSTL